MTNEREDRKKANITLPESLKEQTKEEGSMSQVIEYALRDYFDEKEIHYVNTNAQSVPGDGCKIYNNGVVASYGPEKFGNYLRNISAGNGVVSYVSDSEVPYSGGARAFGIATAPWTGESVSPEEQIYDKDHREYHVPVKWIGVLDEDEVVSPSEIRGITGRKTPQRTLETPGEDYQGGMKLLAEVIIGRTVLKDIL